MQESQLIGKDPDAGEDRGQEKRATEDEMVGWHHRLDGHEFEQTPGNSEGQGSLACCMCPTVCNPMDCSMLGFPAHHQLVELAEAQVH